MKNCMKKQAKLHKPRSTKKNNSAPIMKNCMKKQPFLHEAEHIINIKQ